MTSHAAPVSRRKAKKDEWRRQIAHAAVTLFEEKSFGATTMDEIAAAADVSRPTVFNYFARKEDIPEFFMGWMLEDRVAARLDGWTALPPQDALRSCLVALATIFADFRETSRTFHMLRMQEGRKEFLPPPGHPMHRVMACLDGWIEAGQAAGTFRRDFRAREMAPHLCIGLFASTYGLWMLGEYGDAPYPAVLERHFDLLIGGLSG
ncbi:MAG: TetR/AcrR family transcriptional regulator [Candidatus Sericytochromatia bacterium]|nr:TetR/AcrR family transcriptional regulator [Candidatus Tanganyikabacteria bacterium]